jgi:DNA-binding transcriptional MerR regulator
MYSITDLANEFNITTRTLRFYEEKGLLNPARNNQARIYNTADRVTLKLILRGKRLGFTLNESISIIKLYDPMSGSKDQLLTLKEKIVAKQYMLRQQQQDIEQMMQDLKDAESRCSESLFEIDKESVTLQG